ncbi:MAG: carboxypeptidase-like regulatory domain-containing protein [Clostridiales bacterium]
MKIIITLLLIIPTLLSCATIKGTVTDEDDNKPLIAVNLMIIMPAKMNKGAVTSADGKFILGNLSIGDYTIRVTYIGYWNKNFTFSVKKEDEILNFDIKLKVGAVYMDSVSEIENYHRSFSQLKPEDILDIHVDSLEFWKIKLKEGSYSFDFFLHSTFTNKTEKDIFVIADLPCKSLITPVIKNSKGEIVRNNMIRFDCMEKVIPDSSDLMVIHPHSSIKYPPVRMTLYNFLYYPKDTYTIKMLYKFSRPNKLPGLFSDPDRDYKNIYRNAILYLNTALRGEYISTNEVKFDNSKISVK